MAYTGWLDAFKMIDILLKKHLRLNPPVLVLFQHSVEQLGLILTGMCGTTTKQTD